MDECAEVLKKIVNNCNKYLNFTWGPPALQHTSSVGLDRRHSETWKRLKVGKAKELTGLVDISESSLIMNALGFCNQHNE
jgi:hypothetical protein